MIGAAVVAVLVICFAVNSGSSQANKVLLGLWEYPYYTQRTGEYQGVINDGLSKTTTVVMADCVLTFEKGNTLVEEYEFICEDSSKHTVTNQYKYEIGILTDDGDSTGAVTGNIVGANVGLSGIPRKYTENLELRDIIMEIADDLYNDCKISEYGDYGDEVWESKYIYKTYPEIRK